MNFVLAASANFRQRHTLRLSFIIGFNICYTPCLLPLYICAVSNENQRKLLRHRVTHECDIDSFDIGLLEGFPVQISVFGSACPLCYLPRPMNQMFASLYPCWGCILSHQCEGNCLHLLEQSVCVRTVYHCKSRSPPVGIESGLLSPIYCCVSAYMYIQSNVLRSLFASVFSSLYCFMVFFLTGLAAKVCY